MMAIYPRVLMINLLYSQVGGEGSAYGSEYSSQISLGWVCRCRSSDCNDAACFLPFAEFRSLTQTSLRRV